MQRLIVLLCFQTPFLSEKKSRRLKAAAKVKTSATFCKIALKQIFLCGESYLCGNMGFSFFDRLVVRQIITVLFLSGAVLTMFPLSIFPFNVWARQAEWVAVGYLAIGLFFLIINRVRLMFVCFGCSAAISFFYNEAKKSAPPAPAPIEQTAPRMGDEILLFDRSKKPPDSLE